MDKDNKKVIGQIIKGLRKSKGLSQLKLSEMLDVSYQQVQKYEKGVNSVSIERLTQIAKALDVPISIFFPSEKGMISESAAIYGSLSQDEQFLLELFRKIKDKKLKIAIINFIKSLSKSN